MINRTQYRNNGLHSLASYDKYRFSFDDVVLCFFDYLLGGIVVNECKNSLIQHPIRYQSSSWISDAPGDAYQHLQNMPFGEQFIEQRQSSWGATYRFMGKERDSETGFDYFGARYYSSDLSVWLSVDPFAHRYNSISPYILVANNPINLVDPDGRKIMIEGNAKFNKLMLSRIIGLAIISKSSRKLIFDLIKSDQVIKIVDSKEHHNKATQTTGFDKDGYIMYWNEDDANDFIEGGNGNENDPLYNNSFITLAHELSHAWSKFNNIDQWTYYSTDYKWHPEGDDEGTWFIADEFNAVHFENIVRAELGYKLRTHYQGINVFKIRASIDGNGKVENRTDNTNYDYYRRNNKRANGTDVQNKIRIKKTKGAFDRHKTVLSL